MSTDNELIARSHLDPAVFAALYDRHAPAVYRYLAQRLGDHTADDVMSETFLVAFERRDSYDREVTDARPWLLGIATRLMRKHARLEAVAWKGMVADMAAQVAPDFIERAGARMDAERLTRRLSSALGKLSDTDRDTLLLYAWAHLDYAAIAAATEVPIGTVRSRLNRARRVLRRAAGTDTLEQETDHGRTDVAPQHA
ncbi:sigma-70 family RNA polymerase sigma factor [Microbacterium sp. PRF11]|uniref:RNA polymerase sigma factor n=1 Tax=Microbacterium sp. PRF11 TaxID=2962593 RepID=UPI0028820780|nr:sigma-70 family RNA polymerase sigma factor [Microbacterium sp. PRF11]MDT0118291.1 sigma-70 family RNA polymerase sigma factor [Microbacterium sp. PRF11]